MLFGDDPWVNLVCSCAGYAILPASLLGLLYLLWKRLWPRVLRDVRDTYRYVTGPDEE